MANKMEMECSDTKSAEKCLAKDKNECYIPKRYIFSILGCMGLSNLFSMRVNLSVAIVAMVNSSTVHLPNNMSECLNLVSLSNSTETRKSIGEQYDWNSDEQGLILGAFYYGYFVTQLPGGYLSHKFGAKWFFGGSIFITAILTLLTPLAANLGVAPLIAVRILGGLAQGVAYPSISKMISHWSHKLERSRMSTTVFTGSQIGNVLCMAVTGWLSSSRVLGGWSSSFYVFGALGCVWFIFWALLISETPASHPDISKEELIYLLENDDKTKTENSELKTPWKAILTSVPMWAIIAADIGNAFGLIMFMTELPLYMSSILHFNIQKDGLLSALPFTIQAVSAWIASYIADSLRKSNRLSITNIRKLCNSIGLFGPALCFLGITVARCRPYFIVTLFVLSRALNGFVYSGFNVIHIDMSPSFAGIMFAINNTLSTLSGIIEPSIVGAFLEKGSTITQWNAIFYISAAIHTISGLLFAAFASAELQPWGTGERDLTTNNQVNNGKFPSHLTTDTSNYNGMDYKLEPVLNTLEETITKVKLIRQNQKCS